MSDYKMTIWIGLLLMLDLSTWAQPTYFNRSYDNDGATLWASSILVLSDTAYVVVGNTADYFDVDGIFISQLNAQGDTSWLKYYGKPDHKYWSSIDNGFVRTTDGNYAMGGSITYPNGDDDCWLVKFKPNGDTLWTKSFGGSGQDVAYRCRQTFDHGFVLIGFTTSFGDPNGNIYLVKTDHNGQLEFSKTYGGIGDEVGISVEQTSDKGYFICGYTNSFGEEGIYIIKTDSLGNKQWDKVLPMNGSYGGFGFPSKDGYIVCGIKSSVDGRGDEGYMAKISLSGNAIIWEKTFGGKNNDWFEAAFDGPDGNIWVSGESNSFNQDSNSPLGWLMKISANGDSLWSRTYYTRTDKNNYIRTIQPTPDQGMIMGGSAWQNTQNMWLIKVDSMGCESPDCTYKTNINRLSPTFANKITAFPNPTNSIATISIRLKTVTEDDIICSYYALSGKEVHLTTKLKRTDYGWDVMLNKGNLESGLYIYRIFINQNLFGTGKLFFY